MASKFDGEYEYTGYREQRLLEKKQPYEVIYSYGTAI